MLSLWFLQSMGESRIKRADSNGKLVARPE
jgi:hypothetical protein